MPEAGPAGAGGSAEGKPTPLRIACLGECMVELREQAPGLFAQSFAGDTHNTAVYLSRLGAGRFEVDYACGFGDDAFAADMLAAWRVESIGRRLARRIPGRGTGLYSIRTDARGERQFSYWRERSAARDYFDVARTPLEAALTSIDLLILSGISLAVLSGALPERLPALIRHLREAGGRVAFDNNFRPGLWPSADAARAGFDALYVCADFAFITLDDEAALRPALGEAALLESIFASPCAEVIVKRGAHSTLVRHAGSIAEVPTFPVARVVDTTAAGDAFAAAYLSRRLAGAGPAESAAFGNRLAATVIQHPGAIIDATFMPRL